MFRKINTYVGMLLNLGRWCIDLIFNQSNKVRNWGKYIEILKSFW